MTKKILGISMLFLCNIIICGCENNIEKYDDDGRLIIKVDKNAKDSIVYSYDKKTNKLISENHYWNSQLNKKVTFYLNGSIHDITNYKDGRIFGEFLSYYSNQKIEVKSLYKNGIEVFFEKYFPNGNIMEKRLSDSITGKMGYLLKQDSIGNKDFECVFPVIRNSRDTICLNQAYKIEITFLDIFKDKISLLINNDTINKLNEVYEYTYYPKKVGDDLIQIKFLHYENAIIDMGNAKYKHSFNVLDCNTALLEPTSVGV